MKYATLSLGFTENVAIKYFCSDFDICELLCVASCIMIQKRGL